MLGRRDPQGDLFRADNVLRGYVGEDSFYGLLAQHAAGWFSDDSFGAEEQGLRHGVRRYAAQCLARCVDAILKVFRGRLSRCDYTPRHEAGHRRNVRIIPNTAEFPASIHMRLQTRCAVDRFLDVLQLPLVFLAPRRVFAFPGLFEVPFLVAVQPATHTSERSGAPARVHVASARPRQRVDMGCLNSARHQARESSLLPSGRKGPTQRTPQQRVRATAP